MLLDNMFNVKKSLNNISRCTLVKNSNLRTRLFTFEYIVKFSFWVAVETIIPCMLLMYSFYFVFVLLHSDETILRRKDKEFRLAIVVSQSRCRTAGALQDIQLKSSDIRVPMCNHVLVALQTC